MAEIVNGPFPHNIETRAHRFERMVLSSDAQYAANAVSIRDSRQVSRGRPVRPFSRICTVAQAVRYFGNNDGTTFTELLDTRIQAFAICKIGERYSLRCEPFEQVIVHFVLKSESFLGCEHGRFPLPRHPPGTSIQ